MLWVNKSRQTSGGIPAPDSWFGSLENIDSPEAKNIVERIDQAVAAIGGGDFFMKLSTRSPKDSKILRERGEKIKIEEKKN